MAFQMVIKNALDATQHKGHDARVIARITATQANCNILFEDNGWGMTEQQVADAFVPFRSTKAKGTGLGLPAAYSIVPSTVGIWKLIPKQDEARES